MFVKPNTNPKYAPTLGDDKAPNPNADPARHQLQVWDPSRRDFLPPEGRDVGKENELHWHRRLLAGDVTELSAEDGAKAVEAADKARAEAATLKAKEEAAKKAAEAPAPQADTGTKVNNTGGGKSAGDK